MKHLCLLFPDLVSYNCFVELEKKVAIPLALFIKKVLQGKCPGISFVDSMPLSVCKNQRIWGIVQKRHMFYGMVFRI